MRREPHFVSFWRLGDDSNTYDFIRLDPSTAVMVAMFDGRRSVRQVIEEFSRVAKVSEHEVRSALARFVANDSGRLVPADNVLERGCRQYDPRSFVIPLRDVDLNTKRPGAPMSLIWNITNDCVADCIYCFAERQRHGRGGPLLPFTRVMEIIEEIADLGVAGVVIEGGDPFTYPHIAEVVEAMIDKGIHISLSTKCELSEDLIQRLAESGLPKLQVSIDTLDEHIHLLLTRSRGLLRKTMTTAQRAAAAGMRVDSNAVVTRYNFRDIRPLTEKMISMGVTFVHFADYTRSIYVPRDDLFLSAQQLQEVKDTVNELQAAHQDVSIRFDQEQLVPFAERGICTGGVQSCVIFPDGKVGLCEQTPSVEAAIVGDLSRQSLSQVWNSARIEAFLQPERSFFRGTVCENCPDFDECHMFRGRCFIKSLKAYGKLFGPVPECPRAPEPGVPLRSGDPGAAKSGVVI